MAARLLDQQIRGKTGVHKGPTEVLSDRELEVFQLIGGWKKTSEIARELHISVKTVEYYREQIKQKLLLKDGAELVQRAVKWCEEKS